MNCLFLKEKVAEIENVNTQILIHFLIYLGDSSRDEDVNT